MANCTHFFFIFLMFLFYFFRKFLIVTHMIWYGSGILYWLPSLSQTLNQLVQGELAPGLKQIKHPVPIISISEVCFLIL
jgi:hypothetical protein